MRRVFRTRPYTHKLTCRTGLYEESCASRNSRCFCEESSYEYQNILQRFWSSWRTCTYAHADLISRCQTCEHSVFRSKCCSHVPQINGQTAKAEDKRVLDKLARIMMYFNLSFVQEKNEDGQFAYKLDPYARISNNWVDTESRDFITERSMCLYTMTASELQISHRRDMLYGITLLSRCVRTICSCCLLAQSMPVGTRCKPKITFKRGGTSNSSEYHRRLQAVSRLFVWSRYELRKPTDLSLPLLEMLL